MKAISSLPRLVPGALAMILAGVSIASADVIPTGPIVVMINGFESGTDPAEGQIFTRQISEIDSRGDFFFEDGDRAGSGRWSLEELSVSGNIDPVANLNFAVTNTTDSDLDFIFTVTVPIAPPLPSTLIGGAAAYTVTDANGDFSAEISDTAGAPFFAGLLDGIVALELLDAPFSTTTFASSGDSESTPGFPATTISAGPALSTIGIEVRFTLSARDSASGSTTFNVVPEPTTLLVVVSGVMIAAGVRSRG